MSQQLHNAGSRTSRRAPAARGFSLLELMIAMLIFMLIGAATMNLIKAHMPMATTMANQSGLTMNLRNALAQVELDAVNAGTGYYPGASVPAWPVGFTIVNAPETSACNNSSNYTFGANCFDKLNIISGDPTVGAMQPTAAVDTDAVSTATLTVPAGITPANLATSLAPGVELMWVTTSSPTHITTTVLSQPSVANTAANTVTVTFTKTTTSGTTTGVNTSDPYLIASSPDPSATNTMILGSSFATSDYVIKLSPITYSVDLTTPTDPKLIRSDGTNVDVVAEQIIGFRVGASTRFNQVTSNYIFNASAPSVAMGCSSGCGYNNDWAQVRAIRVSVIGRTTPNSDIATNYHNSFDGGTYKIQGLSVTINPRNLSMTDQ